MLIEGCLVGDASDGFNLVLGEIGCGVCYEISWLFHDSLMVFKLNKF